MPERHIEAAIESIDEGVNEIRDLVGRVEKLDDSRRRFKMLMVLIILGMFATAGVFGYTLYRSNHDRVISCRASNDRFDRLFDFVELQTETDEGRAFVVGMRATSVIDCDNDSEVADDLTTPTTEE